MGTIGETGQDYEEIAYRASGLKGITDMSAWSRLQNYLIMNCGSQVQGEIENLCALAIVEEREACAKILEDEVADGEEHHEHGVVPYTLDLAERIRARTSNT